MKILLIEDEPDLGATIQKSLSHHQYIVDWAIDGQSGWEYLTIDPTIYALAIVDWMLPKLSGIELCQRLRSHNYTLPILMLTAKDRMEDKIAGLDAGADDYLVKPFGMAELLARMRALQRRAPTFKPERLHLGNMELDYGNNGILVTGKQGNLSQINLTAKEFQLLEYLMQHPNTTLTHERIRSRIWSIDSDAASNVVAAQIRLLRKKLSESDCLPTIETIRGFGYRLICN